MYTFYQIREIISHAHKSESFKRNGELLLKEKENHNGNVFGDQVFFLSLLEPSVMEVLILYIIQMSEVFP